MSEWMHVEYEEDENNLVQIQGRKSETFVATDLALNRTIVVKEIPWFELDKDYYRECRLLYENRHPNIAEIHFAGIKNQVYNGDNLNYKGQKMNFLCLSMPFYKNGSLRAKINKGLTIEETVKYMLDILQGAHHLHSNNVLHRDLKPDNILISDNNKAIITDLGLSYKTQDGTYSNGDLFQLLIAPESMTAEQITNKKTEIWQLGIILYSMLTRTCIEEKYHDFVKKNNKNVNNIRMYFSECILNGSYYNLESLPKSIPLKIRRILEKMLAIDPEDRYESVIDISNDLSLVK